MNAANLVFLLIVFVVVCGLAALALTLFSPGYVRERLAALYGSRGRFTLSPVEPRGTRATLEIPIDPAS